RDGMIGDIYSMGLALQALESTSKFYAPRDWDCEQAFSVVYSHDYELPMAIAQVLPALVGKSYLEAASLDCSADVALSPTLESSTSPNLGTTNFPRATIEVHYSVINTLRGQHFHYTIAVHVPEGSKLLKVLQVAEEKEPEKFSFQTEQTSWGPMVVSINKVAADTNDRTYWQFLSGGEPLEEGVGTYKPRDGEHIEAVFSTY
ncbi:IF factor, partial [Trogon melanurus]|nr:IF factor [Trogon melanurus]